MHGLASDYLLQTIPRIPPNHATILQEHSDPSRPVANDLNLTGMEVRNSTHDQPLQSSPNEDSSMEL